MFYNYNGDCMKKLFKRSNDLLLFLLLFIFIVFYFKDKITKKNIFDYMINTNYKKNYSFNYDLPLMSNLYKYDKLTNTEVNNIIEDKNVYIFNTHYEEGYKDTNVIEMSKVLTEKLKSEGINAIFEDTNYKEYVITNNLIGINNYIMIRKIIEEKIKSKDMSLVIDLHRDSIKKSDSVINIDGKSYAKVLFVVDNYYSNYLVKYDLANRFNNYLNSKYKGISRGVYVKNGKGFNQDLSDNMILLELGGYENNKEELLNTIDIIASVIKEIIY